MQSSGSSPRRVQLTADGSHVLAHSFARYSGMHWAESESGSSLVATICDTEAVVQHERRGAHSLHCVFASP